VTVDPWKPPSGWDRDPPPAKEEGPWTVFRVLRVMWRAFRAQPFGVLVAVCVLPGLWTVPGTIVYDRFVSEDEPVFGPGRSLAAVVASFGLAAWGSVWYAGQQSAALAALRGQPIEWRPFIHGLRRAPVLFLSAALFTVPFELASLLPLEVSRSDGFSVTDVVGMLLMAYVSARTCLWVPILVDTRQPFFEALKESWVMTRGAVIRLVLLACILITATLPIALVEVSFVNYWHASMAVISAHYVMAATTLYVFVYPQQASGNTPITVSSNREP
jgi:hypothetical protein